MANFAGLSNAQYQPSWALGGYTEISLDSHWKIQPEFIFKSPSGASNLGSHFQIPNLPDSLFSESKVYVNVVSFSIPIYIKYRTKYVGFGIGPQVSLAYSSKLVEKEKTDFGREITVKDKFKSHIRAFDFGITGLLEFYLTPQKGVASMRIGMKYYYGITNPLRDYSGIHNSVFMLSLGIPIISKKKPEKKQQEPASP